MYIFLYSTDIDFIFDSSATLKDENVRKKHFPLHVSIRNNGMDNVITIDKLWGNYLIEIKQINPKYIDNYKYTFTNSSYHRCYGSPLYTNGCKIKFSKN